MEPGEDPRTSLQRSVVIYSGLLLLIVAAGFSAVGILNRELYSAPAFVRIYLEALARHDVAAALATPGVDRIGDDQPGTGSAALLTPDALGDLDDVALVSDVEITPGRHRMVFSYTLTGDDDHVIPSQTEFDVTRTGTSWLFFPTWEFARSPIASATVTVSHADDFTAGSTQVAVADAQDEFHATGSYEVLVPSVTMLSHRSTYLGAHPVALVATKPLGAVSAIVDVQPTTGFLTAVQDAVDAFLDDCAAETLLYPPGCPFGLDVNDRIASEPVWSIESYPQLTILAGQDTWVVPSSAASARVRVDIRSLFDGTVSTRDESVPFDVTFTVTIEPDDSIAFSPRL
ncbi:hypothetical protein GCM10009851_07290 [Herbiconiux moechotypicola]|uniref:Uncharacterized protein n=1 Tax=Herbiconiux moechotypicola TaxID=637393 RepID=A0ABN3DB08_9MICO